jgi:hypothetical protein
MADAYDRYACRWIETIARGFLQIEVCVEIMNILMQIDLKSYGSRKAIKAVLETQFEAMTRLNMAWLKLHPGAPLLYKSGVRYKNDPYKPKNSRITTENWSDIPSIIRKGADDCESLSSWLAAEMRVRKIHSVGVGKRPGAVVALRHTKAKNLWHAIVYDRVTGRIWDPSRALGMSRHPRPKGVTL